jgi:hypothetical protein
MLVCMTVDSDDRLTCRRAFVATVTESVELCTNTEVA